MHNRLGYSPVLLSAIILLGACTHAPFGTQIPVSSPPAEVDSNPGPPNPVTHSSSESSTEGDSSPTADEVTPLPEQTIIIQDHSQARDAAVVHVSQAYELKKPNEWREEDITPKDLVGSAEFRYTSGPWVVHVTAPVVAPQEVMYSVTIDHLQSGLHWEGMVNAFGHMAERNISPPLSVTSPEQSRDWALAYIMQFHEITLPTEWTFQDTPQTMIGATRYVYTSGPWVVNVIEPASAPMAADYNVSVDNIQEGFHWEGDVSTQGDITEGNP